jgi:predicted Zn-ribbon and HTH transcriptional regulator
MVSLCLLQTILMSSSMSSKKKNINNSFPKAKNKQVISLMEDNLSSHKDRNNSTLLNGQSSEVTKQKNFMICESCLWCASSYFHSYRINVAVKCPYCKDGTIEFLPILW